MLAAYCYFHLSYALLIWRQLFLRSFSDLNATTNDYCCLKQTAKKCQVAADVAESVLSAKVVTVKHAK
jgi:hypothetical protein